MATAAASDTGGDDNGDGEVGEVGEVSDDNSVGKKRNVVCYVHGFQTPFANAVKSGAIYSRSFAEAARLVVVFSWPSDPELVSQSWLVTKVMSDFERNYTHAEQHVSCFYCYFYLLLLFLLPRCR